MFEGCSLDLDLGGESSSPAFDAMNFLPEKLLTEVHFKNK